MHLSSCSFPTLPFPPTTLLPAAYVAWPCLRAPTTSFITLQPSDLCATEHLLIEETTEKPWNIGSVVLRPRGHLKDGSNHMGKQVNENLCRGTHRTPCTVNLIRAVISHFPIPYLKVEEVGRRVEENSHKMLMNWCSQSSSKQVAAAERR